MMVNETDVLKMIRGGMKQTDIAKSLGISKSSASRLCRRAVLSGGNKADRKSLNLRDRTLLQLLWDRVDRTNFCWIWVGHVKQNGYGSFNYKGAPVHPHRVMYQTFVSEIADGLVIDHICENKRCCNPDHLQAVTINENLYFIKARPKHG